MLEDLGALGGTVAVLLLFKWLDAPAFVRTTAWAAVLLVFGVVLSHYWSPAYEAKRSLEAWLAPRRALEEVASQDRQRAANQIQAYQEGTVFRDTPLLDGSGKIQRVLSGGTPVFIYGNALIPESLGSATDGRAFYYVRLRDKFKLPSKAEGDSGYLESMAVKNLGVAQLPGFNVVGERAGVLPTPGPDGTFILDLAPNEASPLIYTFGQWWTEGTVYIGILGRKELIKITDEDGFTDLSHIRGKAFYFVGGEKGNRVRMTVLPSPR